VLPLAPLPLLSDGLATRDDGGWHDAFEDSAAVVGKLLLAVDCDSVAARGAPMEGAGGGWQRNFQILFNKARCMLSRSGQLAKSTISLKPPRWW
jgi:hypothetical protein